MPRTVVAKGTSMKITCLGALYACALIFAVSANATPTYTDLHDFDLAVDGGYATGLLAQGRNGNLYGTSLQGGADGVGTAFRITTAGTFTKLHDFVTSNDGYCSAPHGGLSLGKDGNFYGTTCSGGANGYGTFFKMTAAGVVTALHSFTDTDGMYPYAPPIQGRDGSFYGTTIAGGSGFGTIYKISPTGTLKVLYNFDCTHGLGSYEPLIVGTDGNFYGTTHTDCGSGGGYVFKITPSGAYTVLFDFDNFSGMLPYAPVMQGANGNLYGTTTAGGAGYNSGGTIFRLTLKGSYTVLHNFDNNANFSEGLGPSSGLVLATDGNFYGVTNYGGDGSLNYNSGCGVLYKITPAGAYTVVYTFDGTHGCMPTAPTLHTDGKLYGLTLNGGANNTGVVYSLDIGASPFVTAVPRAAKVGQSVGLLGALSGTSAVTFNGVPAVFKGAWNSYRTTVVPAGAATGLITVTTTTGTLSGNKTFFALPTLAGFSPPSGAVGYTLILSGTSLTQTKKVSFGGNKSASFTVNNDSQVTVTIPAGAVSGKIVITTQGGKATSAASFTVTP